MSEFSRRFALKSGRSIVLRERIDRAHAEMHVGADLAGEAGGSTLLVLEREITTLVISTTCLGQHDSRALVDASTLIAAQIQRDS